MLKNEIEDPALFPSGASISGTTSSPFSSAIVFPYQIWQLIRFIFRPLWLNRVKYYYSDQNVFLLKGAL